jgi:hypothetical protein
MASSLDHIEQTLADAYRKEIDQEENIWRSLPFFAATLTLELGAVFQIAGHLPPVGTGAWQVTVGCIMVAAVATMTALSFLAASIVPAKFNYLPPGPYLLEYAERLDDYERWCVAHGDTSADALVLLTRTLAHADPSHYNRQISRRRGMWREELVPRAVLEAEHRAADQKRANRRSLKSLIFGRG